MGVNLKDLIKKRNIEFKELSNKKIGVDAYNWSHQFLSTIRLRTGELLKDSEGRVTSHITGIFTRTTNLLKANIKPCYVWDGEPPEFKSKERARRKKRKKKARKKFEKAKTEAEKMKYAQQLSRLTKEMIKDANALLDGLGVPHVQASSEGEAQIAHMIKNGDLWACASQDWDSILFGSDYLIRNLSVSKKKKIAGKHAYKKILPNLVDLNYNLKELNLNRKQLIIIAMLIGTDYCKGVKGYGPKRSLKLVKKAKSLNNVLKEVDWKCDSDPYKILNWFLNPKSTDNYNMKWKELNVEKLMKVLVDKHEFKQKRVESQIEPIVGERAKKDQKGLSNFF